MRAAVRKFDLNIERVLEHWTVAHAVREILANALDEQALTGTAEPEIRKDEQGRWRIRDWGRGLRYEHLTQKESREKLERPMLVIGKFGVGLKDAAATFHRHRVGVTIRSRHGDISIMKEPKHGFADLSTLHARIETASEPEMVGTDVVLDGVADRDIAAAQRFFLRYANLPLLDSTPIGSIYQRARSAAGIYVNGLLIAEEPNFLFSYNITTPTRTLRQALNRERRAVGRSAYSERVKAILLAATGPAVAGTLATEIQRFATGAMRDELSWIDVALQACRILHAREKVIFLTASEAAQARSYSDRARDDGYTLVVVSGSVRAKLRAALDIAGAPMCDMTRYCEDWGRSFRVDPLPPARLSAAEQAILAATPAILQLAGGQPRRVKDVVISESLRAANDHAEAAAAWDPERRRIIIGRGQLASLASYAGALLHELIHAESGADDASPEFEHALTDALGRLAARQLAAGAASL